MARKTDGAGTPSGMLGQKLVHAERDLVSQAEYLSAALKLGAPALHGLLYDASQKSRYLPLGFSVRHGSGGWLAIARAHDVEEGRAVVCFGGGASVDWALGNLSREIARGGWRLDRYEANGADAKKDAGR